jgi:hypothetical protein
MDKRAEHLSTLGLGPDASWDEVTQAYKDLMRVWHPDRFQADDRLRKKAEEQAQRINNAMGELKKLGKAGFEKAKAQPQARPRREPQRPTPNRASQYNYQHSSQHSSQSSQASHTHYSIAPLHIRPKVSSMIVRVSIALGIMYLAYDSLLRPFSNPQQEAFTIAIIFVALDLGSRSLLMLLIPKPLISVDSSGLFLLKTGRLSWFDIESVWPVITPRFSQLSVRLSPAYVAKQSIIPRLFLLMRRWGNTAHVTVPFNGLASDPVQVVNAMKLFQLHNQLALVESKPINSRAILLMQILAVACFAVPVFRCLFEGGLSTAEYAVYLVLFLIVRIVEFTLRIGRSKAL